MSKINIGFEITDNFDTQGFRNFIKLIMSNDTYDVFLISTDNDSAYITKTGENLGLPTSNVITCNFVSDKIDAINDKKIDIFLDNLQSTTILIDTDTNAQGILVNPNLNRYYLEPDYVLVFDRLISEINGKNN
jgi:hypothetical protein